MAGLNPKQKRFVAEYLKDANATQAAIKAGYSAKTARQIGARLLSHVNVRSALDAGAAKVGSKLEITAARVLQELALIGFANMADYLGPDGRLDLKNVDRDKWAAVGEITVDRIGEEVVRTKFKLLDKRAALTDLGRHFNLFRQSFDLPPDDPNTESENIPMRELARRMLFGLSLAIRQPATPASAEPTKH